MRFAFSLLLLASCVNFGPVLAEESPGVLSPTGGTDIDGLPPEQMDMKMLRVDALSSAHIRQGASADLTVSGENLDLLTAASCTASGVTCTFSGTTVHVVAAHGAAIGAFDVSLNGTAHAGGFITAIHASLTGSDAASGNDEAPFRTISHALATATAGDTVRLGQGAFGLMEMFPQAETTQQLGFIPPNIQNGVTVKGEGADKTVVIGPGSGAGDDRRVAFSFAGNGSLNGVNVSGFRFGVFGTSGAVAIDHVMVGNTTLDGIAIRDSVSATITNTEVSAADGAGIYYNSNAPMNVSSSNIHGNGAAGTGGIHLRSEGGALGDVTLDHVTLSDNKLTGLLVQNPGPLLNLTINACTFTENFNNSVVFDGNNRVIAKGSTFTQVGGATLPVRFSASTGQNDARWDFGSLDVNPGASNHFVVNQAGGVFFTDDRSSASLARAHVLVGSTFELVDLVAEPDGHYNQFFIVGSFASAPPGVFQTNGPIGCDSLVVE